MNTGEMVCSDQFNLLFAMSASEVGNPQLDLSMNSLESLSIEERLDKNLITFDFSIENIIYIVDQLSIYEYICYNGYPMSQTLMSCVYANCEVMDQLYERSFLKGNKLDCNSFLSGYLYVYILILFKSYQLCLDLIATTGAADVNKYFISKEEDIIFPYECFFKPYLEFKKDNVIDAMILD